MFRLSGAALLALIVTAGAVVAQTSLLPNQLMPQRPNPVRPGNPSVMQNPSYMTPEQRKLNLPGATTNPSLRRQTPPYTSQVPVPPPAPPRPAAAPVPAETPAKPPPL